MMSGKYAWPYLSAPQAHLDGRVLYLPRGKVLGGGSSINGMTYDRGFHSDYDRWAQAGNTGWSYAEVLPYFCKLETFAPFDDAWHGQGGPIRVTRAGQDHPFARAFVEAGKQAGYPYCDDLNGALRDGFGPVDLTVGKGRRSSASRRARSRSWCFWTPSPIRQTSRPAKRSNTFPLLPSLRRRSSASTRKSRSRPCSSDGGPPGRLRKTIGSQYNGERKVLFEKKSAADWIVESTSTRPNSAGESDRVRIGSRTIPTSFPTAAPSANSAESRARRPKPPLAGVVGAGEGSGSVTARRIGRASCRERVCSVV